MELLFTICGRAGSKGVKNKNIKEFAGYPLPFYTASIIDLFIKKNNNIQSDIVLNTDSDKLIDLFKSNINLHIHYIKREPELSKDSTPKIAVIKNCFQAMNQEYKKKYKMIIDLDITSPLRTMEDLSNIIEKKDNSKADIVFSVTESRRNPYFNMVMKTEKGYERVIKSSFNSRQEAPQIFDMNASMYAYSPEFLLSGKGIFDGRCDIIKMRDTAVLDIDNENDFELMQIIANYLYKTNSDYKIVQENIEKIII